MLEEIFVIRNRQLLKVAMPAPNPVAVYTRVELAVSIPELFTRQYRNFLLRGLRVVAGGLTMTIYDLCLL